MLFRSELIQARFTKMMEAVDEARSTQAEAQSKMESLKKMTEVDQTLMKSHLDHWRSVMGSELDAYGLAVGANGNDMAMEMLTKADPGVQHTVSNIIKCASAHMAKHAAAPQAQSTKRKAEVLDEPKPEPQAAAPEPVWEGSVLERALAAQFM